MENNDHAPLTSKQPLHRVVAATTPPPTRSLNDIRNFLQKIAPDEPLGPPEVRQHWPRWVHELREEFPGYQPGSVYRVRMLYCRLPSQKAHWTTWLTTIVNFAKAIWSAAIHENKTRLQFVEWLPSYLDDDKCWMGTPCRAMEFLREVYDMPPSLRPWRDAK